MANTREPILQPVSILSLRPTQMTVGMREVKEKRKRLREYWKEHKSKKKQGEFLGKHMIPVVLGPDKDRYVVDHHHLACALHGEGIEDILVTIIGDLTMVERDAFWGVMDNKRWLYPYDANRFMLAGLILSSASLARPSVSKDEVREPGNDWSHGIGALGKFEG